MVAGSKRIQLAGEGGGVGHEAGRAGMQGPHPPCLRRKTLPVIHSVICPNKKLTSSCARGTPRRAFSPCTACCPPGIARCRTERSDLPLLLRMGCATAIDGELRELEFGQETQRNLTLQALSSWIVFCHHVRCVDCDPGVWGLEKVCWDCGVVCCLLPCIKLHLRVFGFRSCPLSVPSVWPPLGAFVSFVWFFSSPSNGFCGTVCSVHAIRGSVCAIAQRR